MAPVRVFAGSPYEVGLARGKTLLGLPVPPAGPDEVAFARACAGVVAEVFPAALDTFRGVVAGSGLAGDDFLAYYFARQEGVLRGCTMVAVSPPAAREAGVLVGRNYDWAYSDRKWCEARCLLTEGFPPVVGYTHHWAGLPDALNGEGLFVAIASLPREPRVGPGFQWNLAVDAVMAACRTVAEAARLLGSVTHLRAMSYLLADASGDATVVEAFPGRVTVRRPEGGVLIATNHEVAGDEASERAARSRGRYDRVAGALRAAAGRVDEGVVKTILSDHEGRVCAGLHKGQPRPYHRGDEWGTIWSSLCRPGSRSLLIAPGHPCETPYEPVGFGVQVPDSGYC